MTTRQTRHLGVTGFLRAVAFGLAAGVPAGLASFVFLELLDRAIEFREHGRGWLVLLLPPAALAISAAYHHLGGRAGGGTALVMLETDRPSAPGVPARMAPMVLAATVLSHLFGASVGREGVALQMAGSLADGPTRRVLGVHTPGGIGEAGRIMLLHAALAGGFGSVFGVPWAGLVFSFEVRRRRPRPLLAVAAATSAFAGDLVVRLLGHGHRRYPQLPLDIGPVVIAKAIAAGAVFGVVAVLFVLATSGVRRTLARIGYPPLRAAMAGLIVLAGSGALGKEYLSLSLPLAGGALNGAPTPSFAWLTKLGFTAVSIGGGIPGGEVTPLFVTGATLGAAVGHLLGAPLGLFAGLGFVAVFAAGAKTPIACTVMFAELFGLPGTVAALLACLMARAVSGTRSIYPPTAAPPRVEVNRRLAG